MRGSIVIDLQFGSTGKGLIAGHLAERDSPDTVLTAWAPNAGHTYIDGKGTKYVHTMLANGIVSRRLDRVMMGPGSLIDPVALKAEIDAAGTLLRGVDILIHPNAAIVTQEHRDLEAGPMTKIGSTKKGVGEAMIQRIRRNPDDMNTAGIVDSEGRLKAHPLLAEHGLHGHLATHEEWHNAMATARRVLVEGAQGYSLSMYHGFYPYCTSRDVSTHQVLADVGIPPKAARSLIVIGTVRSFPIRVANRFDGAGKQVGWSGPCYDDQRELDWMLDLGREAELTTVTKLPRRIFSLSHKQLAEATLQCGADEIFLNFVNYCKNPLDAQRLLVAVRQTVGLRGAELRYIGMGPTERDVIDLRDFPAGAHSQELLAAMAPYFPGASA